MSNVYIYEVLQEGKEKAVTRDVILSRLGLDARSFYAQINRERIEGKCILSVGGGYFIGTDKDIDALRDNIRRLESMGRENLRVAAALRCFLDQISGLEGGENGSKGEMV